ncbi:MAG: hypothetical protein IKX59_01215 [Bacteroidales bacterium]|nr:hypothetical protein [Bacteroidales bacterium]
MVVVQLLCKLFSLTIGDEGSAIVPSVPEDCSMIEVREHLLPLAAMVIIVADGLEDEAVVGVVDVVFVVRLRLEQGITSMLGIALKAENSNCEQAVKPLKLKKRRVGMLLDHCLYPIERGIDFAIASAARGEGDEDERE